MSSPAKLVQRLALSDETLFRLNAYLSTFSGTDKALMLLQYAPLLVIPLLPQQPMGKLPIEPRGLQRLRGSLQALSSTVGDSRILIRLFGLIPILAWYRQLRLKRQAAATAAAAAASTSSDLNSSSLKPWPDANRLQALQVYSMLAYYPMEHIWYLASKGVLPLKESRIMKFALWSCRAWMAYVLLSLVELYNTRKELQVTDDTSSPAEEKDAKETLRLRVLTELSYLPLTAHWSLSSGLWESSFFTGLFGTAAALAQLQLGWKETAVAHASGTAAAEGKEVAATDAEQEKKRN